MFGQHHEKTCIIYPPGHYLKKQEKNTKHIALLYYISSLKVKMKVRTQCLFFCYRDIWSDRYITLSSFLSFQFCGEPLHTGNPWSSNCQSNDLLVWTFRKKFPVFFGTGKNSHKKIAALFSTMSLLQYS
jgi:hypothetical protein